MEAAVEELEEEEYLEEVEYDDEEEHSWHPPFAVNLDNFRRLDFKEVPTGCGIMTVRGVACVPEDVLKKGLLQAKPILLETDVGIIFATLGQSYYSSESTLRKVGFVRLLEYPNLRHGSATQRMYYLLVKNFGRKRGRPRKE